MKRLRAATIIGWFLFFTNSMAYSQSFAQVPKTTIIKPYYLQITFYKTTLLVFPTSIKSVDRGSPDVLAQKAKDVENILLVKAGKKNFKESNLSVITSDGRLYCFVVQYSDNPSMLNISFTKDTALKEETALLPLGNSASEWQACAKRVAEEKRFMYGIKDSKYKIRFLLSGLYFKNDHIFCQLEIKNRSYIDYDIDLLRFFIRDEKIAKRTASQEIELKPLYIYGDSSVVKAQSANTLVYTFSKFTIPDQKYFLIQLMEKNGGRHLQLKVHDRIIAKTRLLN